MSHIAARRLIWVPIVHSQADLGSLGKTVRCAYVRRFGKGTWDRHIKTVDELWERTREATAGLGLDYAQVRLYQDGLPHCGREAEIVRDLAEAGSLNHRLLLELMGKGAELMGTESPELLVEEYQILRQTMLSQEATRPRGLARRQKELSRIILDKRDRYITERIDQTLAPGGTGLLFLGMLHSLEGHLPATIEVTRLFPASQAASRVNPRKRRGREG